MAKLHEILAVEGDLEGTFKKILDETRATFEKKADHFYEVVKETRHFNTAQANLDTTETKALVDTVPSKLAYTEGAVVKYFDTIAAKEATNQIASADLVVDGVTIAAKVPATMLLGLEQRLKHVRAVYEAMPTLQPGIDWRAAPDRGHGIYVSAVPIERFKTQKQLQYKVLVPQDEHHPAQVEKWNEDVPIAKITERAWSGMVTPAEKSEVLGRIDRLIRATKKARQRANSVEAVKPKIGRSIFDFIRGNTAAVPDAED